LKELGKSGYDVVGLDWTVEPEIGREQIGQDVTLQGNLDPCALYAPAEQLEVMVKDMVTKFGKRRWIANLGHGIYPDMEPDSVKNLVKFIHKHTTAL